MSESKELSPAQKLVGDFAPKLAELTDDVLFKVSSFFDHRDPAMVKWLGTRKLDI